MRSSADDTAAVPAFPASLPGARLFGLPRRGRVTAYDAERGLGSLEEVSEPGEETGTFPFHCTAIADGSRHVDVGAPVVFVLVPGLGGLMEAGAVTVVRTEGRRETGGRLAEPHGFTPEPVAPS